MDFLSPKLYKLINLKIWVLDKNYGSAGSSDSRYELEKVVM